MSETAIMYFAAGVAGLFLLLVVCNRWLATLLSLYYLLFSLMPVMYPGIEDAPSWKIYRILYLILIIGSIAQVLHWSSGAPLSFGQGFWMPYAATSIVFCLSAIYAPLGAVDVWDPNNGLVGRVVVILLYWIAATLIQQEKDLRYFVRATVLCGLIVSFWVIYYAWRSGFLASRAGLDVNQNLVVDFIAIGMIPMVDFCFVCNRVVLKVVALGAVLISMYGVYLTGSRGATLALGLAVATIVWKRGQNSSKTRVALSVAGVAIACGLVVILPGEGNSLQRVLVTPESSMAIDARTSAIWPLLLNQLSNRSLPQWLIGDGMNSSSSLLRTTFGSGWGDAHNMYLQAAYDQGLIGLGLLLLFIHSVKKRMPQAPIAYLCLFYGWVTYLLIMGMTEVEANGKLFWMLLGVIAGSCVLRKKGRRSAHRVEGMAIPERKHPTIEPIRDEVQGMSRA